MPPKRKPKPRSSGAGQSPAGPGKATRKKATGAKKGHAAPSGRAKRKGTTASGHPPTPLGNFPKASMGPRDVKRASGNKSDREGNLRPRKSTETPGGLRQTSVYLRPEEFEALYQRAAEETVKRGVRVSIGEIMRAAIRKHLGLK